jgi:hypothetical protein
MLRAITMTMRHTPQQKLPITPNLLYKICQVCDTQFEIGKVLKAAYLTLFFSFVRQSSISPKKSSAFDCTRQLTRADVFNTSTGIVLLIKWTKTHQTGQHVLLPIPTMPRHPHCPVTAIRAIMTQPSSQPPKFTPLFQYPRQQASITTTFLADALRVILTSLNVTPEQYSLHSFRRGGATSAFHAGVNVTQIKRHGTWVSDAFWNYVTTSTLHSQVPQALAEALAYQQ